MKKIIISCCLSVGILSAGELASCIGCHGKNFEKSAMGKSKIVKNMSVQDIKSALDGYKNHTYGGELKTIMYAQVRNIKDTDHAANSIKAVSNGDKPKPNKAKFLKKIKKIESCVEKAEDKSNM